MGEAIPFNSAKTILSFRCVARTVTFKVFENLALKRGEGNQAPLITSQSWNISKSD